MSVKLLINGEEAVFERPMTIAELLEAREVRDRRYVSVEYNDRILDREEFGKVVVRDGDRVEFLYFMGGGR
ncbi:MAG: sulfur carrier protein ThiS [bacterium]